MRIEHDLAISVASSVAPFSPPVTPHPLSPIQIESPSCTALELCARNWADVALKTLRLEAIDTVVYFMFGCRNVVCDAAFIDGGVWLVGSDDRFFRSGKCFSTDK